MRHSKIAKNFPTIVFSFSREVSGHISDQIFPVLSRKPITSGRHGAARHGPNGFNGKQLSATYYERPARQSTARHVMGFSQLLSIKTIRAVPCRGVPAARNGFPALTSHCLLHNSSHDSHAKSRLGFPPTDI